MGSRCFGSRNGAQRYFFFHLIYNILFFFNKGIELGYSTMNRRLYLGALGIGPAWARVDDCGVCVAWDRRVAPVISREYREAEALLKAACPTIFDGFCLDITRKAQSLDHSTKFCELLRVHPMIHPDCEAKYFCDDIGEVDQLPP